MKKTLLIVTLVVLALGVLGVGAAFAQGQQPPIGPAMMGYGYGPLHTYVVEAFAAELGLSVDEVNQRLLNGETMYQIALAEGVAESDIPALLTRVHETALAAAVADGVITQQQADWMLAHMQNMWQNGHGIGNCPMYGGAGAQGGRFGPGYGSGMMGSGQGMMGGLRWQNP